MPTISEIMHRKVETVRPESTLGEVITVLCEKGISGAPVLAGDGLLVGIISEFALMDVLFDPGLKNAPVSEYMTKEVHTLSEKDSLTRAVHKFAVYGVRRLPVVREGKLVGIVSRRDLITACLSLEEPLIAPLQEFMPELSSMPAYVPEGILEQIDFA